MERQRRARRHQKRAQYPGFDIAKIIAAVLVVFRHAVQTEFAAGTPVYEIVFCWLSNLAVPVFFTISGFLLFGKAEKPSRLPVKTVAKYLWRIFKLYLLWSLLYFPFNYYFWTQEGMVTTFAGFMQDYVRKFFLTSNVIQLWYLPGLLVACVLVFALTKARIPAALVLAASFVVYAFGSALGYEEIRQYYLPGWCLDFCDQYYPVFETTRNGFFYGFFFVSLGMMLTRVKLRAWMKYAGLAVFAAFLAAMYFEVHLMGENDMVLCAAPATAGLFLFLRGIRLRPRPVYREMRSLSEWIYLAHAIPLYLYAALDGAGVLNLKPWSAVAAVSAAGLLLSAGLWALSCTHAFRFLRKAV